MARPSRKRQQVLQDLAVIAVSIIAAVFIVQSGVVHGAAASFHTLGYFGSFLAGMFFTSVFTTAPAMAVLGELAQINSPWTVAFWGGLGAVAGDYIIFRFVRDRVADDVSFLLQHSHVRRIPAIFRTKLFHRLLPFVGAIIIASPLPDELGLALLGVSRIRLRTFFLLSFAFNTLGILLIGWIATSALGPTLW